MPCIAEIIIPSPEQNRRHQVVPADACQCLGIAAVEPAVRQWPRLDETPAGAVASVDAARLKNVGYLYRTSLPLPNAAPAARRTDGNAGRKTARRRILNAAGQVNIRPRIAMG
jgi:hypothetical protein